MHRSEPLIGHSVYPKGHHSFDFFLGVVDISKLFLDLGYQHLGYLLLIVDTCPVQHYKIVRPLKNHNSLTCVLPGVFDLVELQIVLRC